MRLTRWRRPVTLFVLAIMVALPLLQLRPAKAFKPYTHNYVGYQAYDDAVDDGYVTVNGHAYAVDTRVVTALRNQRGSYNAGVIGPDGFPDFAYGQSVIHPTNSGEWMQYIFEQAWAAQSNAAYSATDKEKILAFAYGYLTHAAGDMWAHTIVNDFSGNKFPDYGDALTDPNIAAIIVRHIIVEGYIGDATPGWDTNPDVTQLPDGDWSNDSTPGVELDAPHQWIYDALINPAAATPTTGRGVAIDFFIDLRSQLVTALNNLPATDTAVSAALSTYNTLSANADAVRISCGIDDIDDFDLVDCLSAIGEFGLDAITGAWDIVTSAVADAANTVVNAIARAYLNAWIADIDSGLQHWDEFGLAITRALFDKQALRDAQNWICRNEPGGDGGTLRNQCEAGVGMVDVLLFEADDFINNHLLSMLGAPDFVGQARDFFGDVADVIDDVLAPLNWLTAPLDELKAYVKEFIQDQIEAALGIDIDQIQSFLTHPYYWLNFEQTTLSLPGLGDVQLQLFAPGDHERLDAAMGLTGDHHEGTFLPGFPDSSRLADDAEVTPETFPVLKNSITTAKLLLLDGATLDQVLGDNLTDAGVIQSAGFVSRYGPKDLPNLPTNVMFQPFSGTEPWLYSIDSDHAWRQDGLPVFCNEGEQSCADFASLNPTARSSDLNGGIGQFPIWESCLLRPAFRTLYTDWEDGAQNFPDLGDATSTDANDAIYPTPTLTVSGTTYSAGGTQYVARNHTFTFHASDNVFTAASLSGQYRAYPTGTTPSAWQPIGEGGTFALPDNAADGQWTVDYRAADPCNSFAAADASSTDIDATTLVTLDTTAPGIAIADPDQGAVYKRFSKHPADYACSDASSGVATCVGPVADNANFDTGSVGPKTFTVNATDQLGNPSSQTIAYTIDADMAVDGIVGIRSNCGGPGCLKLGVEIRSQRYGVPGATVTITVKRPDGSVATLTGLTSNTGAAGWSFPLSGPGAYVVTVTNVSAPYYNYIPANNAITTRTYTIANR